MELRGMKGRIRITTPCSDHWHYRSFVNSPDPRLRKLVALFAAAG